MNQEALQKDLSIIAAALALPLVDHEIERMNNRAYRGFSTIPPETFERLQQELAPWRTRRDDLLRIILGSTTQP